VIQLAHESLTVPRRPPLRYHGGKWRIAPWIIDHLPDHRTFVEIFGGAAGVLLRKPRSHAEVYNDLDSEVFNFFSVLRNSTKELCRLVDLTSFSRDEFDLTHEATDDPLESARRFVARCFLGRSASSSALDSSGFAGCDIRTRKSYAREWAGVPDALAAAADRLQGVTIENLHFRRLIPKFDHRDSVFYADPPYPLLTRAANGKGYLHEMTDPDYRELAWLLKTCKARVLISGYDCGLYDELYQGWRRDEKATTANGQAGAVQRTEVLWMNF
jgi:DNA adenine methylase